MSTASARRAGRPDPAQYGSAGLQQRARAAAAAAAGSARRRGEFVVAGPGQQPAADSERARSQLRHDAGLARPETSWGRGPEAAREPPSATARAHRGSASARGADPAEGSWAGDALAPSHSGGDGGRGLLWGARIDDRLDRLERLLEVAAGRHQDVEERLTAMTTRYAEQQNQLEELRFEVRRRPPPEATPPPPQPAAPAPPGRGPDSLVLAGQLQAMQRQCDALGSQVAEMHASTSTAQGLDDKVARIQKLKELGTNAWRGAHEPVAESLLDSADRLGMLMWVENREFGQETDGCKSKSSLLAFQNVSREGTSS